MDQCSENNIKSDTTGFNGFHRNLNKSVGKMERLKCNFRADTKKCMF